MYYGETRLKDIYPYATKFEVFKFKFAKFVYKSFVYSFIGITAVTLFFVGWASGMYTSVVTKVQAEPNSPVVEALAPVMERIAHCESSGTHTKNGQVIFKANTDGSVDIGLYQINSVHNKEASKLGYDLTNEKDNEAFALYLYHNYGTSPWSASAKCWNK